jgi:hypothetical protein
LLLSGPTMSLPPWIRSIKRPLDKLAGVRRSYEDLPDTEPGEELGTASRRRMVDADFGNAPTEPPEDPAAK